jgi:transcriptional regulator with XRE-family HTH domain
MNIKELRKQSKLTQDEFAKALGISVVTLRSYETGKANPSAKIRTLIKKAYGVELDDTVEAVPAKKEKSGSKKQSEPRIIIQSPYGGEVTVFSILAKVGDVDTIYIRTDHNKAYWVKGTKSGSIDLW